MTPIGAQEEKELARRESHGIAVSLRWDPETGDVSVLVEDSELAESFVVRAEPEHALKVFHHPYAYARNLPRAQGARMTGRYE
jgi:hypothetical protein